MKALRFILLFGLAVLFSCESTDDDANGVTDNGTYKCDVGYITLRARIGEDLDSALDSLLKVKTVLSDTPYVVVHKRDTNEKG